jgi:hypothetical protein
LYIAFGNAFRTKIPVIINRFDHHNRGL